MSRFTSPVPVQRGEDHQNLLHGNSQHARFGQAHEGPFPDFEHFWYDFRNPCPSVVHVDLLEIYGDPEVHPQQED